MSKTKAITKRNEVPSTRRRRKPVSWRERLQMMRRADGRRARDVPRTRGDLLVELEPKVRGLWWSSTEQHLRLDRQDDTIDKLNERLATLHEYVSNMVALHEYKAHGELISITERPPLELPTAPQEPQFRLVKGGLTESATIVSSANRPQLTLLKGGAE
jgi:hypothetical protein